MAKKQKSGLYRTAVKIGVDADGKDIRKWISGKTKRELEQKRQEVIKYYISGDEVKSEELFGAYATRWYRTNKEPFIAPGTRDEYKYKMNHYILPFFGDRRITAIRRMDVQEFANNLVNVHKVQPKSIVRMVSSVFKSAISDRLINHNPTDGVHLPESKVNKKRRIFTPEERTAIENGIMTHKYGAFVACHYYTGMRIGEVLGLQWQDIDFDKNTIHVERNIDGHGTGDEKIGHLKTQASHRVIPMVTKLKSILLPMRGLPNTFVFHTGKMTNIPYSRASRDMRKFIIDIGLVDEDGDNIISAHDFRHNYISMCWENGIDPLVTQKIAGHSTLSVTMDIYTHLSSDRLKCANEQIESIFQKKVAK